MIRAAISLTVWAEQNTRAAVFDALHRREAYGTSGPRIKLKFGTAGQDACSKATIPFDVTMGGTLNAQQTRSPWFAIQAGKDFVPLEKIQIIKGEVRGGTVRERVVTVAGFDKGRSSACTVWQDPEFDAKVPAYWYARVLEEKSPRWSKLLCEQADLCAQFPEADQMVAERAWSSPIWHLP